MAPSRVRIPPSPLAQRPPCRCAHPRRGGRAVECGGLENRYPSFGGSRVQIPPPPLRKPAPPQTRGFQAAGDTSMLEGTLTMRVGEDTIAKRLDFPTATLDRGVEWSRRPRASGSAGSARRADEPAAVSPQVVRARAEGRGLVVGVEQAAAVERETATADAGGEAVAEGLQGHDPTVEVGAPGP